MVSYRLVKAHHPLMFEKNVFAVHFAEKGKPLLDRYTQFFQLEAKSRSDAIRKAKRLLR